LFGLTNWDANNANNWWVKRGPYPTGTTIDVFDPRLVASATSVSNPAAYSEKGDYVWMLKTGLITADGGVTSKKGVWRINKSSGAYEQVFSDSALSGDGDVCQSGN